MFINRQMDKENVAHIYNGVLYCAMLSHCETLWIPCQAPLSVGVLQARILEWVAMSSSRGFSQSRDQTQICQGSPMKYYSAIKKNKILPFVAAWIDLEAIMLSGISQTEKDRY